MVIIPLVAETGEDAQNSTLLTCKTREFSLLAEAMSRRTCLATQVYRQEGQRDCRDESNNY